MGGRGASSGISTKGNKYGSQYHSVYESGNIKFVTKKQQRFRNAYGNDDKGTRICTC